MKAADFENHKEGTSEALQAISGMTHEATDGTCWQCGAPADPDCVYLQGLVNRADYADGQGVSRNKKCVGKPYRQSSHSLL
jgi:hypothetical protein